MVLIDNNEDVVVFFDFENIVYSLRNNLGENPNFEVLMDKCQEYGRIVLARAYADWSRHNTVIAPLQASGFDPVYVPTYFYESKERKARKNAVDIHIAIEAVEVMFTQPHINTFILLTGDKDFIPLANALRRNGKKVIAIGVQGTTSPYMRQATDDFVFYQQLFEEVKGKEDEPLQKDIYQVLVETVTKLQEEDQKTVFPQVKHSMTEVLGNFNEKDYTDAKGNNFNRFKDFILEAQRIGHVQLVTTGSVNEVLLPGDPVRSQEEVEPAIQGPEPKPIPIVTDTESAYELLVWAVNHASETGKSPRTSSIKTIMRRAHQGFDEKQFVNDAGENFAKFSDFARAATRQGMVRIEGKGIRMEIHPEGGLTADDEPDIETLVEAIDESPDVLEPEPDVPETFSEPEAAPPPLESSFSEETDISEEYSVLEDQPILDEPLVVEESPSPTEDEVERASSLSDEMIPPPQEPYAYVSDYRMRVLVVDALRTMEYPAPAHEIGKQCIVASQQRNISLPNRRLSQLLSNAHEMGLLEDANEEGVEEQKFSFVENTQQIKLFLEDETM